MRRQTTVAAIDVGSTKVAVIVADAGVVGEARILGVGVAPAAGLTRGVIDNISTARESIGIAIEKAEQACGLRILSAVVGISGAHISSQSNRGIVAVADRSRISLDDRARVLDAAAKIAIPTNRQVLHVLNKNGAPGGMLPADFLRAAGQSPDITIPYDRDVAAASSLGVKGVQTCATLQRGLAPLFSLMAGEAEEVHHSLFDRTLGRLLHRS